jgi:hypothetical protein
MNRKSVSPEAESVLSLLKCAIDLAEREKDDYQKEYALFNLYEPIIEAIRKHQEVISKENY